MEKERERNVPSGCMTPRPTAQACALTLNRTGELSVCGMTPNPLNHSSQGICIFKCLG